MWYTLQTITKQKGDMCPMSTPVHSFRSAAFGGFQREDVLHYIESTTKKHQEALKSAQRDKDEAVKASEKASQALRESQLRIAELEISMSQLKRELEEQGENITQREDSWKKADSQSTQLQDEVESLRQQVAEMERAAGAYEVLKNRTATIELEAHQRAQEIESAAQVRAKEIRAKAETLLQSARQMHQQLGHNLASTITHATQQQERMKAVMEQLEQAVAQEKESPL